MEEEKIIWFKKPSKKFIIYYSFLHFNKKESGFNPLALTLLIFFWILGFIALLIYSVLGNTKIYGLWLFLIVIGVVLGLAAIIAVIYNTFLRKSYLYIITDKNVKMSGGIFKKINKIAPLSKITDIKISQNILERFVGIYNLHIQTAGSKSIEPEISFIALNDPYTPKNLILKYAQKREGLYNE